MQRDEELGTPEEPSKIDAAEGLLEPCTAEHFTTKPFPTGSCTLPYDPCHIYTKQQINFEHTNNNNSITHLTMTPNALCVGRNASDKEAENPGYDASEIPEHPTHEKPYCIVDATDNGDAYTDMSSMYMRSPAGGTTEPVSRSLNTVPNISPDLSLIHI